MITLFKDDINQFVASVNISGTAGAERMARLILEFKNRKLMFDGVFKDNRVMVEIPKLMEILDDSGVMTLEIIADRTFFEAYSSDFQLTLKKSIEVDEVSVVRSEPINVVVEDINLQKDDVEEEIFIEGCSTRNKQTAQSFIAKHNEDDEIDSEFPEAVRTWGQQVFIDTESKNALIAMTQVAKRLNN